MKPASSCLVALLIGIQIQGKVIVRSIDGGHQQIITSLCSMVEQNDWATKN